MELIWRDEDGFLSPISDGIPGAERLEQWAESACEHARAWAAAEGWSWPAFRRLEWALRSTPAASLPALKALVRSASEGGYTSPDAAIAALQEICGFPEIVRAQLVELFDVATGETISTAMPWYNGESILVSGPKSSSGGFDAGGLFIRGADGEELFRARCAAVTRHGHGEYEYQNADDRSDRFRWAADLAKTDGHRTVSVRSRPFRPSDIDFSVERLMRLCQACEETRNGIYWW